MKVYSNGLNNHTSDPDESPSPVHVAICRAWIELNCAPRKSINTRHSSYGLKHVVEVDSRGPQGYEYVTNGAFIQAALDLGYKAVRCHYSSPNAHFNMSFAPRETRERAARLLAKAEQKQRVSAMRAAFRASRLGGVQ